MSFTITSCKRYLNGICLILRGDAMIENMPTCLDELSSRCFECAVDDGRGRTSPGDALDYESPIKIEDKGTMPRAYLEGHTRDEFSGIVGKSSELKMTLNLASIVAPT